MLLRHIPFLKSVFIYSFTAFGGPQGHMGMMVKTFVQKRKDVTEDELLEYNAFCQMLPGPSSTQTVTLIAFKRGGIPLACVTLLLWIFPAALIMSLFSFLIVYVIPGNGRLGKNIPLNLFSYIQPMSVGFVCYAAARMMRNSVKYLATTAIMIGSIVGTLMFRTPWIFPVLLILSGTLSNFSNKRIPGTQQKPKKINWINLWVFALLFLVAGVMSELARTQNWEHGFVYHLFENFYRFGSIVFGGGQALTPMIYYQYIDLPAHLPTHHTAVLTAEQLRIGYGLVQAVPGPVFSVCSYVGGITMSQYGPGWQLLGCIVATMAVFLPSTLLLFFFFPIYENLKHHVIIFRALEGINASMVGIIWASGIVLFQSLPVFEWGNVVVVIITFCLLYFSKIPSPLIVIGWLLLGWTLHV